VLSEQLRRKRLRLSRKVDECKPLVIGSDAHILELNKESHPFNVTPAVFGAKAGGVMRTSNQIDV